MLPSNLAKIVVSQSNQYLVTNCASNENMDYYNVFAIALHVLHICVNVGVFHEISYIIFITTYIPLNCLHKFKYDKEF